MDREPSNKHYVGCTWYYWFLHSNLVEMSSMYLSGDVFRVSLRTWLGGLPPRDLAALTVRLTVVLQQILSRMKHSWHLTCKTTKVVRKTLLLLQHAHPQKNSRSLLKKFGCMEIATQALGCQECRTVSGLSLKVTESGWSALSPNLDTVLSVFLSQLCKGFSTLAMHASTWPD